MYLMLVFISAQSAPVILGFKGEDTLAGATSALETVDNMIMGGGQIKRTKLSDDFGQNITLYAAPAAIVIQDIAQAREIDIERGINQLITQAKTMERSNSEPSILAARRAMQPGPAVFTPMGGPMNGGSRGF